MHARRGDHHLVCGCCDGWRLNARLCAPAPLQAEYRNGLHYINSQNSWWHPDVLTCSSLKGDGVDKVWEKADSFWDLGTSNGMFGSIRLHPYVWLDETATVYLTLAVSG